VVQELDASFLQGSLYGLNILRSAGDAVHPGRFHAADRVDVNTRSAGYVRLLSTDKRPSGLQLISRGQHVSVFQL
jgi:hypothetical protein